MAKDAVLFGQQRRRLGDLHRRVLLLRTGLGGPENLSAYKWAWMPPRPAEEVVRILQSLGGESAQAPQGKKAEADAINMR